MALIALARDGSVTHRWARRANALVLLDDGLSCEQVAKMLLLDDDTILRWHGAFATGAAVFGDEREMVAGSDVETRQQPAPGAVEHGDGEMWVRGAQIRHASAPVSIQILAKT